MFGFNILRLYLGLVHGHGEGGTDKKGPMKVTLPTSLPAEGLDMLKLMVLNINLAIMETVNLKLKYHPLVVAQVRV
jgi:hypothetical protein